MAAAARRDLRRPARTSPPGGAGALVGLVLAAGSRSPAQVNVSSAYLAGFLTTGLAITAAIGLWAIAAAAMARHLTLDPRLRAVQLVLVAVTPAAVTVVLVTLNLWAVNPSAQRTQGRHRA
jgi:hypothetical protein